MTEARFKAIEKIVLEIHEYFIHSNFTTPDQKRLLERLYDDWKSACRSEKGFK